MTLPTPPGAKESVHVAKVMSITAGDGGDGLDVQSYMPVRTALNWSRSKYDKGRWTPEFKRNVESRYGLLEQRT